MLSDERFQARHGSTWRLTPKGIYQAQAAGNVIRPLIQNCDSENRFYYVSPYIRACETAAYLGLPGAAWKITESLRERDWGELERLPEDEKLLHYARCVEQRSIQPFYWRPAGGESLADVSDRGRDVLGTIHRDQPSYGNSVGVLVCHGEVMWSYRYLLERMTMQQFLELEHSRDPKHRIHNGHVFQYTRQNPDDPGDIRPMLRWFRSVAPTIEGMQTWTTWSTIEYRRYTNEALLEMIHEYPSLVSLIDGE